MTSDEPIRLSKRMSELGLASRREADEWIERGWVRVDGTLAILGVKVLPNQKITIDERARKQQARQLTVILHKPIGYVSGQAEDGYQPAVVLVTLENQWRIPALKSVSAGPLRRQDLFGLAPAGRLDIDSTGLLVLTQDGRIAKQLIGEDSEVEKEYLVRVRYGRGGKLPDAGLRRLEHGLVLDGKPLRRAKVFWQNEDQLRFVLREGKKRQIRRMCEAVGLQVLGLKRVRVGEVMLGDLPQGKWRLLAPGESFAAPERAGDRGDGHSKVRSESRERSGRDTRGGPRAKTSRPPGPAEAQRDSTPQPRAKRVFAKNTNRKETP